MQKGSGDGEEWVPPYIIAHSSLGEVDLAIIEHFLAKSRWEYCNTLGGATFEDGLDP